MVENGAMDSSARRQLFGGELAPMGNLWGEVVNGAASAGDWMDADGPRRAALTGSFSYCSLFLAQIGGDPSNFCAPFKNVAKAKTTIEGEGGGLFCVNLGSHRRGRLIGRKCKF